MLEVKLSWISDSPCTDKEKCVTGEEKSTLSSDLQCSGTDCPKAVPGSGLHSVADCWAGRHEGNYVEME